MSSMAANVEERRMTLSLRARKARLALAGVVSAALLWVIWPYIGAIFWGVVLAIVFAPLHAWILRLSGGRRLLAGLATLFVIVVGVVVPLALLASALLRQAATLYADIAAGRIDLGAYLERVIDALPAWARQALDGSGIGELSWIREKLSASAVEASQFVATQLLGFGLNAFSLALSLAIMLYLLYVLLSEGRSLAARIERFSPLPADETRSLATTFSTVIRATVKGGVVMAATQGLLGGLMLGLLGVEATLFWGVVFGLLSMIPAVGAGLLWAPLALYFLMTGAVAKGIVLILFGTVVLTVVDNVLRPFLVGRDTQLPGYMVLVATLGGVASFGLNGIIVGPMVAALFVATWKLFESIETPVRPV
jgi:predicted PurR-regulated permease PerM